VETGEDIPPLHIMERGTGGEVTDREEGAGGVDISFIQLYSCIILKGH